MTFKKTLFLLLILVLTLSAFACNTTTTETALSYEDFEYFDRYQDAFNRREGTYLIYIYSTTCTVCATFKPEVIAFAAAYTDEVIYFFDSGAATDAATSQPAFLAAIGQASLQTPTLLLIKDGAFDLTNIDKYFFSGIPAIRNILNDLTNNSYPYYS